MLGSANLLSGGGDVKSLVLRVLSTRFPLTAKGIHRAILSGHYAVSYQAVHKTVVQLCEDNVLEKEGNAYKISAEWVTHARGFVNSLERAYAGEKPRFSDFQEGDAASVVFDKADGIYYWLMDEIDWLCKQPEFYKPTAMRWRHMWPTTMVEKTRYLQLAYLVLSHNPKVVCSHQTAFDKLIESYWEKLRGNTIFKNDKRESDVLVFADFVVDVFWPKSFRNAMDKLYAESDKDLGAATSLIYKLNFEKKTNIPVTVTKRKVLAQQIRKEILDDFKRR